tara:strand:+ start:326 stop:733 length:408 start_codon:yes stop_codon:yes gene_type:complete
LLLSGFGKAKSSGVLGRDQGRKWIHAQAGCGGVKHQCFCVRPTHNHVTFGEEFPVLGFEMGLKPEDSMNAGWDQPEGRAFSEQAEIHLEASVDNPLRLADAFVDVRVDTESGVEWLPGLFAAVLINAAAVMEFHG